MTATSLDARPQGGLPSRSSETGRRGRRKQKLPPLFDGQHIICPHCRNKTSILDIKTLPEMPVYQHETVPVYQCACTFVFALRSSPVGLPRRNQ